MVVMIVVACIAGLRSASRSSGTYTRGSRVTTLSRTEFDEECDLLVATGEAEKAGRAAAWRDFDGWQVTNERERLRSEESGEE